MSGFVLYFLIVALVELHTYLNYFIFLVYAPELLHHTIHMQYSGKILDFVTERVLEDHEKVIEALAHWPKVHRNTTHFRNNPDKYLLLTRPQVCVHMVST